ncbi:restriction endonuclease subunit S [Lentilactobacillus hilgardii]|uniref:Type I restriction modification DNA specificity domain protein n=2 Tax=Lentilactobacillus hilgardii TaxID=1588 RepID=C0XJM7_LENH9|nr:restriction endonuclease subunit S [Lentilactobacillus hilgardii]EEI24356.1 type I restriction modification DNA specificity domain protein [Lentilactobacillus hilgardii DSM 20176 = ATCC 8290]QEU37790.1 restriction endonuclease subunit S [Lentilactobacillus hilgardii]TDG81415.1 hypothetical protein C5L34_002467 [Lentilactobacillus hilgardii]
MSEEKQPKIRFKGFDDPWEQRKLGEGLKQLKSYSLPRKYEVPESDTEYIHYGDIHTSSRKYVDKSFRLPNIKSGDFQLLQTGDIVLADASEDYKEIAEPMLMKNIKGRKVVSGLHTIAIRLKCGDPVYYLYLFLSPGFRHYVYKVGTGLKVFGINYDKVQKYFLAVPDEKEQKYIGKILFLTDQLIAANQSKLEQLKRLKKLLMQKIFNQEWRFKGFTDPWEQRKLGEIFEERKENPKGQTLKMLSVTINSGIVDANVLNRKDNSNSNKSNYKVVHANDIAYNSMRMWQGASGVSNELGIVSPAYTVLKPRVGLDVRFWGYLFKLTKMLQEFQKNSQGLTSDTWNLKYKQIKSIEVTMPSKNEQNAISQLLQKLDFSIAANLRQRLNNLLNIDNYSRLSINA